VDFNLASPAISIILCSTNLFLISLRLRYETPLLSKLSAPDEVAAAFVLSDKRISAEPSSSSGTAPEEIWALKDYLNLLSFCVFAMTSAAAL
jgi:hypothetical protein